jgi:hypothetical protein
LSTQTVADTINSAATDPVPAMPVPLSNQVKLLRGLGKKQPDGSDEWYDVAEVRELTGADEEYLAALEKKEGLTYTDYMTALLSRAVVNIGPLVVDRMPGLLNKLVLADRDMLFLGVVRATYGTTRDIQVVCPKCQALQDVVIDLDEDFPITYPDFDLRDTIKVNTRKGVVQLRLPTGEDTVLAQKNAKDDAQLNTAMLARCAVWDEGEAPVDPLQWARELNVGDRRKLVNALLEVEVGPKLEGVETQCAECGKDMPILLDWVSLLLS